MVHENFTRFLGHQLDEVLREIENEFFGHVVVYRPGENSDASVQQTRLKVFVDDQNFIIKIVNG